jgi:outer membrane immunogenic protein
MIMKKFLLGTLGLVAMGAPAFAADLPARTYSPPPPVVAPVLYDWTGFYIGANGGWGQSHNCVDFLPVGGVLVTDACLSKSGGLFGGQVGYRWQWGGGAVFGLEAQGDWANIKSTHISIFDPAFTLNSKLDALGLFTGQIGYAWGPSLLYVKGGAAVTDNNFFISDTLTGTALATISSATRWGASVGVGFEYLVTPNWSLGIEYDHLFMGNSNNSFSTPNPILAGALNRINQDVDMVTFRFNYKFGWGGPVVARY